MSVASDYLVDLRNGADINRQALASVIAEAQAQREIVLEWPASATKRDMLFRLEEQIRSFQDAKTDAEALVIGAERAVEALGGDAPAIPPAPPAANGGTVWSTREW